jgi:rhamnose transport system ATP-binding protein
VAEKPAGGDREPLLAMREVSKAFGAITALAGVHLELYPGEVHGLVGENGAGKSTLVKVLAGAHAPDAGTLTLAGQPLALHGPAGARATGIAVIYQEPTLFPDLSVAENIFMGRPPVGKGRRIDWAAMYRRCEELFASLGVHLDPRRPARRHEQPRVEPPGAGTLAGPGRGRGRRGRGSPSERSRAAAGRA